MTCEALGADTTLPRWVGHRMCQPCQPEATTNSQVTPAALCTPPALSAHLLHAVPPQERLWFLVVQMLQTASSLERPSTSQQLSDLDKATLIRSAQV